MGVAYELKYENLKYLFVPSLISKENSTTLKPLTGELISAIRVWSFPKFVPSGILDSLIVLFNENTPENNQETKYNIKDESFTIRTISSGSSQEVEIRAEIIKNNEDSNELKLTITMNKLNEESLIKPFRVINLYARKIDLFISSRWTGLKPFIQRYAVDPKTKCKLLVEEVEE